MTDASHADPTPPLPRIVFLIAYFGKWPKWMSLFIASCGGNPTIDFVLISDAGEPEAMPPNVRLMPIGFDAYRALIATKLSITPRWSDSFKLCDIRPALGYIHPELIAGYDYWGYCDVDVILGDLRKFLDAETLDHDLISAHDKIVSGHMTLYRNTPRMLTAFKRARHWRWLMATAKHKSFDERIMSVMFAGEDSRRRHGIHRFLVPHMSGGHFVERYSTPLPGLTWIDGTQNFPSTWFWRDGHLTTDATGPREFMYFHFTHWASRRWTGGDKSVWDHVDPLVRVSSRRPAAFQISAAGFSDCDVPGSEEFEARAGGKAGA